MTRLRAVLAVAMGLFAACGGDSSGSMPGMPDAPPGGGDTTPPSIVSTTPAEGAKHVSVLQHVTVTIDEDLDPATVTAAHVTFGVRSDAWPFAYETGTSDLILTEGPGGSPTNLLQGTVSYDAASKTITFAPTIPLTWQHQYTLTLSGVTDVAGNALPDSAVHFVTSFNRPTRQQNWSTIGQPTGYLMYTLDGNGLLTKYLNYTAPGSDNNWYTNDDYVGEAFEIAFLDDGRVSRAYKMQGGNDGKLNTSDDFRYEGHQYNYAADGRFLERLYAQPTGEGADQMFGTSDDVPTNLFLYQYNGTKLAGFVSYYASGTDTAWRTGDDWCDYYWTYVYDADQRRTRETKTWCNLDHLQNSDDLIGYYHDNTYDPATGVVVMRTQRSVGVDNIPYNGDDDYQWIEKWQLDSAGRVIAYYRYNGKGADATWNTSDDVVQVHTRTTYTASGLPEEVITYSGAGTDTMWGTSDDVIGSYTHTTYDSSGNRTGTKKYGAPGPDSTYRTADDIAVVNIEYDVAH